MVRIMINRLANNQTIGRAANMTNNKRQMSDESRIELEKVIASKNDLSE